MIPSMLISLPLTAFNLTDYLRGDETLPSMRNAIHSKNNENYSDIKNLSTKKTSEKKDKILNLYREWEGTRYRWGGDSKYGIDCSAFTKRIIKEFSVHLPRTTTGQIRYGTRISKKELRVGDLVFFKISVLVRHVGIYIGNDQFIHASRSMGVTTSRLSNSYWMNNYETSIRVI